MAKQTNTATGTTVAAAVAAAVAKAGPQYKPVPGVLTVTKPKATFRGARQAWFNALLAHNGKPANAYLEACATTPPSVPASGRPEAPTGWLSWFVRNGYATVTITPDKAS